MLQTVEQTRPVMHTTADRVLAPTDESYAPLKRAFHFFNDKLFASSLPDCLITLQRGKSYRGYFSPDRFRHRESKRATDEIAMNPDCFVGRSEKDILSTLVHEMAHLWQQHFGKPSRTSYHNKEWAAKMDTLGLTPSSTAAPGGKRTGQRVSHFIVDGGPFDKACTEFLEAGAAGIVWCSMPTVSLGKSGKRAKYTCPDCSTHVWGKSGLSITCNACACEMSGEA